MNVVTVRNCYVYEVCFFDGFVKYDYGQSGVVDSSISCYGSVIVFIIIIFLL